MKLLNISFVLLLLTAVQSTSVGQEEPGLYKQIEIGPQFPGGDQGLQQFLVEHLNYPPTAEKDSVEGMVMVYFTIDTTGKVIDVHVKDSSIRQDLVNEADRVVNHMPNWKPASTRGKKQQVRFKIPILFELPEENEKKN
jgi:protein TonB